MNDWAIVAARAGGSGAIVDMSERVALAYEDDPDTIQSFLEESCPAPKGLWIWEGNTEDTNADGEWRRPTRTEIDRLQKELP